MHCAKQTNLLLLFFYVDSDYGSKVSRMLFSISHSFRVLHAPSS